MSPFPGRHRPPAVDAEVDGGFVATEAPALQQGIKAALHGGEGRRAPIAADLEFAPGAGERVVVEWRNRFVGFVPAPHLATLRGQIAGAGRAKVVATGLVYWDGEYWRVWVGPPPSGGFPAVEPGYDHLEPPPTTIFGIPLTRSRDRRS